MSRYRAYGKLDDPYIEEGDTFFSRMNSRVRPSQLQAGEVQLSKNGRMDIDGTWQPRKGVETLAGKITLDQNSTLLPFVITKANRENDVITITLRFSPNRSFKVGNQITIEGITGFTTDPNGTYTISSISFVNKEIKFAQVGGDEFFVCSENSIADGGSRISTKLDFTLLDQGSATSVFGSALFSDPSSEFIDDFIFTATDSYCSILRLKDKLEFRANYPSGERVTKRCQLLQAFSKLFIFRQDKTTLVSTPILSTALITNASLSGSVVTINATGHGLNGNDYVTISGIQNFTTNPNGAYLVTSATANSFTYKIENSGSETYNVFGASAGYFSNFTNVKSGQYTMPSYIIDSNATSANGVVTINETNHGLELGQDLTIVKGEGNFSNLADTKVKVSSTTADSFKFNLAVEDTASELLVLSQRTPISYFIHQPAAPFGVLNQRRLWLPYFFTSDSNPTKRPTTDEIIASDILDSDTYDVIGNQFKITGGSSDFITAIEPFTENTLVVFGRRSVHRLNGVSGSLQDVQVNVITPDLGCASRNSVAQVANKMIFLSDQGVYALTFMDEYNLRGLEVPLSEPITPTMQRINQQYVDQATGVYFDNRYFLAVPLDGAVENSHILVYNFINQGWESIDSINSLTFNVRDMVVGREGSQNFLYLISSSGSIHKYEGYEGGDQISITTATASPQILDVSSELRTREYAFKTINRKNFNRAEVHMKSSPFSKSNGTIQFQTTDPDSVRSARSVDTLLGAELDSNEDTSIRSSVRLRGYGCSATITPTKGRPYVRAVKLDSRIINRQTTSVT